MGEPTIGHVVFGHIEDFPEIYSVAKFRTAQTHRAARPQRPWTGWHTDITAALNPPKASILRGVTIPPYGGDTLWTNLAVAYQGLSETMRGIVDGLRGIHRFQAPTGTAKSQAYDESVRRREMETEHPIVRVHPETGERLLFVSPSFLKSIVGLTSRESELMLDLLWEHVVRPEYTVRFKWEMGDIAMWDNRATCASGADRHLRFGLRSPALPDHPPGGRARGRGRSPLGRAQRRAHPVGRDRAHGSGRLRATGSLEVDMATTVETALGPIPTAELGPTLMHEHIVTRSPGVQENWPHLWDRAEILTIAERKMTDLHGRGIRTIVDLTTVDLGRDIGLILDVARRSRVHVIVATGVWWMPQRYFNVHGVDHVAELFVRDITQGIGDERREGGHHQVRHRHRRRDAGHREHPARVRSGAEGDRACRSRRTPGRPAASGRRSRRSSRRRAST